MRAADERPRHRTDHLQRHGGCEVNTDVAETNELARLPLRLVAARDQNICCSGQTRPVWGSTQTANPDAPAYGFAFAPFVDAQGTLDTPAKKTDVHDLQAGFDAQLNVLNGPLFDDQYFILTPYYQTDFDGIAQAQGMTLSWEPVKEDIHLGGYSGSPGPYVGWYWQLQTQFDEKHVSTVGHTGLTKGNYEWLGGTVQAHFTFFPSQGAGNPLYVSPDPWLEDRFYMNLTLKSFLNAANDRSATWFEGELGYNLTTDGKSSVSVKYDLGTDKDTLITSKKYLLAINFKN